MIDCDDVVQGKSSLRLLSKNFKRVSSLIVSLSVLCPSRMMCVKRYSYILCVERERDRKIRKNVRKIFKE